MTSIFDKYLDAVSETEPIKRTGVVSRVQGLLIESRGPQASVGELCRINLKDNTESIIAEVIGLNGSTVQLMAYEDIQGVEIGCDVIASGTMLSVPVGSVASSIHSEGRRTANRNPTLPFTTLSLLRHLTHWNGVPLKNES